jgi:hypothetical protein
LDRSTLSKVRPNDPRPVSNRLLTILTFIIIVRRCDALICRSIMKFLKAFAALTKSPLNCGAAIPPVTFSDGGPVRESNRSTDIGLWSGVKQVLWPWDAVEMDIPDPDAIFYE